jgi:DNA-binding SARP family transcriptional activator
MKAGVLGQLILSCDGTDLVPTAPKPRQLLALLMLNANRTVRASDCITELWRDRPPNSAMSTLQTYVVHVRQILRAAPDSDQSHLLVTRNQGYELSVDAGRFDRAQFQSLAGHGRAAVAAGRDELASELFAEALRLWRGPVLADVQAGPLSATHVVELEETRIGVHEQRIEADLRMGRHEQLLDELAALTSTHPTHENMQAQFMLALYRSGKQNRALAVFNRLRALLRESFGLEPAPRMQRLHEAILKGDPALETPPEPVRPRAPQRPALAANAGREMVLG